MFSCNRFRLSQRSSDVDQFLSAISQQDKGAFSERGSLTDVKLGNKHLKFQKNVTQIYIEEHFIVIFITSYDHAKKKMKNFFSVVGLIKR